MLSLIGRMPPYKYVYILIPAVFEYVILNSKRDFADLIKVKDLEMGRLVWFIQLDLRAENLSWLP